MRRRTAGFTLVEVIVAMVILGMTAAVIFGGISRDLRTARLLAENQRRTHFARRELTEIELLDNIAAGDYAHGRFEDGTNWKVETTPFIEPIEGPNPNPNSMIRITLTMDWQTDRGTRSWVVDTYRFVAPGRTARSLQGQLDDLQ